MNKKQQFAVAGDRNGDRGAMAFRRGPAGNHVEPRARDKWERQAEEAAHRILRGERNVARMLTPAPAASLTVPLSRGEPLPVILREQLEEGFGADLSAVRIHRDTAAAAATRNEHAFAFASGRDIYFEEGRYDTTGRRRLLLHEVAHVLQQTGRASSGQVLSATVQNSMGGIQCSPAEIPDFAALRKLHSPAKKGAPENPRFAGVADELAKRVAAGDPAGALEEYFKKSLGKIKDWPAEAESLFYDTLKRYRKFELAAQLIERDDFKGGVRIRTAAWTDELVAALERRNHGSAVYVLAAEKHPALASYTKELARLVEVFIFQPVEAQVPEMRRFDVKEGDTPAKTIEDHVVELSERLDDNTKLSSSEWVFQALHTINRLNNLRKAKCVEIDNVGAKTAAKTNELNIFRKRRDAEGVRDWGDNFLASTKDVFKEGDLQPEEKDKAAWEPFLKKLGARIAEIGRTALDVWDRKKAIDESMAAYNRVPAGDAREAEAIKGLAQVKEAGQKSGLPEQLIHVLTELNRRGAHNESPPPEAEYSKRSLALANTLAEFSAEKLEKQQPELFRKKKTEEVVADIWLSIWVREKASHLRWMGQGPNVALIDERIAQRIRVAKFIKSLARPLAWKEVIEAADVILKAKAENVSQLAILPFPDGKYWHREERSPIEKLSEITEIKGWEPLTGGHLALLYQKDYYDTLAQTIAELAPATDKQEQQLVQSGGLIPFVAGRANEEVRKLPHPERWKVQSYEIAVKGDSKETLLDLIKRHHSFSEISEHSKQQGLEWILPLAGAPFVWFIPPIDFVLPILHGIDLLNAQVAADLPGNEPYAKKLKDAEQLGDSRWFQMLKQHLGRQLKDKKMSQKELQALRAALQHALEDKQKQSWTNLLEAIKKGSRLDRQLIAQSSRSHLIKYVENHYLRHADEALEPIIRFFAAVSMLEDADIDAEMTALMLDLAPDLEAAFGGEDVFDVVYAYLGFLESAVKFLPTFRSMKAEARHVFLPDYQNTSEWINPRAASLEEITKHLQTVRERVQSGGGYKTSASSKSIRVFRLGSPIPVGLRLYPREGQSILGEPKATHYRITKILQNYIYHPAYGFSGGPASGKKKIAATGYAEAKILALDDKTPLAIKPGEKLLEVEVLKGKGRQERVIQVMQLGTGPEDAEMLADIYNGLTWAAFGSQMANINAAIGWYVNTVLDLAEFIPGVGQAITAGRIIATIAEFWANGDYQDLKRLVSGEIRNIVESLLDRIREAADPEHLVQLLLFGDPRLDELLARVNVGKNTEPETDTKKQGRLAKVMNAFRRLGRGVFRVLRLLHKWIQVPMEDVRAFASSRPILSWILRFIADNISTLASLVKKGVSLFARIGEKDDQKKGVVEDLKNTLREQQADLGQHVHGILKTLEQAKLPDTILHLEPIIAWFLDKLEGFVVGRLGLKARAVFLMLKTTGGLAFFNERLTDEIVEAGVDPNIYWREQIVPKIADRFNETRDSVVKGVNGVLGHPALEAVFQPVAPPAKLTLQPEGGPFKVTGEDYVEQPEGTEPDAEPYPSSDRPLRMRPPGIGSYGPGVPLDPRLRSRVESLFGQDFGYVRLHTGGESDRMTGAFGVDGLATGSHVFLRPGLSPESGQGEEVLHHELAHVLQQTGTRPLGGAASSQPVAGHPELGLDYNPLRERVADRIASLVRRGNRQAMPSMQSGNETGFQPSGLELSTISNLLHSFTDLDAIKSAEKVIEDASKRTTATKLPSKAQSAVDKILEFLKDLNKADAQKLLKYHGVFTDAIPLIRNRLNNAAYAEPIQSAAYLIAREALEPLPVPKPAKGAKTQPPSQAEPVLKPTHFARQLEDFILAKTGIVLGLKLKHTTVTAPNGKDVTTVDDATPVERINILHIHLPFIDGRSPLWKDAIHNTWETGASGNVVKVLTDKERDQIRDFARAHAESLGITVGIWALIGKKYRFSFFFKHAVDKLVQDSKTAGAPEMPSTEFYAKTEGASSEVGVRISTYGQPKGPDRNAHHLTQYLVAEYFANVNTTHKPFKPRRDYPGVQWKGNTVELISPTPISNPTNAIQVAETEHGRGEKMPTISLSVPTHRNASLHITQNAADDFPTQTGHVFPSTWVGEKFSLPKELKPEASDKVFEQYRRGRETDIAQKIYDSVQSVYRAVEADMSARLEKRMPKYELQYYVDRAADKQFDIRKDAAHPEELNDAGKLFKKQLEHVPKTAKDKNEEGMAKLGWKLK